jgi:hypothetical protein
MTTYLVWSHEHRAWWGPNHSGYTGDVWSAGRYDEAGALDTCGRRGWPRGAPPPEVMVVAPEDCRPQLTVAEIRAVPELMRQRIEDATRRAMAARLASQQPGEAS